MAKRGPRSKLPPPTTAQETAVRVLALAIEACDRKDGTGADWPMLAEGIFRAGFEAVKKLDDPARLALLARIHAATYERMAASEGGESLAPTAQPEGRGAAVSAFNGPEPKGPG